MLRITRNIATAAVLATAFVLAVVMLVPALAGYQRYVIVSGSMAGTYDVGSVVFDKAVPVDQLQVGDVITYAPPAGETDMPLITHRISDISTDADGVPVFRTKGDANPTADPWKFTLDDSEQARVAFSVPYVGHLVRVLSDRETRMVVIGGPALLIALFVSAGLVRDARSTRRKALPSS